MSNIPKYVIPLWRVKQMDNKHNTPEQQYDKDREVAIEEILQSNDNDNNDDNNNNDLIESIEIEDVDYNIVDNIQTEIGDEPMTEFMTPEDDQPVNDVEIIEKTDSTENTELTETSVDTDTDTDSDASDVSDTQETTELPDYLPDEDDFWKDAIDEWDPEKHPLMKESDVKRLREKPARHGRCRISGLALKKDGTRRLPRNDKGEKRGPRG